jgi:hypothetical protein
MTPGSLDELITTIYEENYSHIDFMENMNGGDCDCNIHNTMNLIEGYMK